MGSNGTRTAPPAGARQAPPASPRDVPIRMSAQAREHRRAVTAGPAWVPATVPTINSSNLTPATS